MLRFGSILTGLINGKILGEFVCSSAEALIFPFYTFMNAAVSCFMCNTEELLHPEIMLSQYFVLGPFYIILCLISVPPGVLGMIIRAFWCTCIKKDKFKIMKVGDVDRETTQLFLRENPSINTTNYYTFCTANLLLGSDIICKLNQNSSGRLRVSRIGTILMSQTEDRLGQCKLNERNVILSAFPAVDFFCFQEVWERSLALELVRILSKKYEYFLYDIGEHSLPVNMCLLGSGLMFVSKYPVMEADFKTFKNRVNQARLTSMGILCVKVYIGCDGDGCNYVGYITNIHTQAFQGCQSVIYEQLSETIKFIDEFKEKTRSSQEISKFDVICGDFNSDNMSPGDMDVQKHPIFSQYGDICVKSPGEDQSWAIGTELRQRMLFKSEISTPELFKKALQDPSKRRLYVLDADVVIHTSALMNAVLLPNQHGRVDPVPYGGMRRVDKILCRDKGNVCGYAFISALTNLTDHLPVCLTLETNFH